jgi:hypothetical protein
VIAFITLPIRVDCMGVARSHCVTKLVTLERKSSAVLINVSGAEAQCWRSKEEMEQLSRMWGMRIGAEDPAITNGFNDKVLRLLIVGTSDGTYGGAPGQQSCMNSAITPCETKWKGTSAPGRYRP